MQISLSSSGAPWTHGALLFFILIVLGGLRIDANFPLGSHIELSLKHI